MIRVRAQVVVPALEPPAISRESSPDRQLEPMAVEDTTEIVNLVLPQDRERPGDVPMVAPISHAEERRLVAQPRIVRGRVFDAVTHLVVSDAGGNPLELSEQDRSPVCVGPAAVVGG